MSHTVLVKGASADRFRAYGPAKMTRKPRVEDHKARAAAGMPAFETGQRIRYDIDEVAVEGSFSGDKFAVSLGNKPVTRIVLYKGPVEEEVIVGSLEFAEPVTGAVDIELVEPKAEPDVIDEADIAGPPAE